MTFYIWHLSLQTQNPTHMEPGPCGVVSQIPPMLGDPTYMKYGTLCVETQSLNM